MQLIADNLQIINPTIQDAVKRMDPDPIRRLVAQCVQAGAQAIDLNMGPLPRNSERMMAFCVETVQVATDLPILIDTANPNAMAAGLAANRKTAVINGFSLEPAKLEAMLPLAKQYQADIIGYLLYPDSRVPQTAAERFSLALGLYDRVQQSGIEKERLIIDPVIVPVAWDDGIQQASEVLSVIGGLPDLLGFGVRTVAGLSNLTAGRGYLLQRRLLERAYLPMLAHAGLSMVLLNVFHEETMRTARGCNCLKAGGVFTWEEL